MGVRAAVFELREGTWGRLLQGLCQVQGVHRPLGAGAFAPVGNSLYETTEGWRQGVGPSNRKTPEGARGKLRRVSNHNKGEQAKVQ